MRACRALMAAMASWATAPIFVASAVPVVKTQKSIVCPGPAGRALAASNFHAAPLLSHRRPRRRHQPSCMAAKIAGLNACSSKVGATSVAAQVHAAVEVSQGRLRIVAWAAWAVWATTVAR